MPFGLSISAFASRWMCVNVRLCRGANFSRHEHKKKKEREVLQAILFWTLRFICMCVKCVTSAVQRARSAAAR